MNIFNQFTEQYSVNQIAQKIKKALKSLNIDVCIKKINNPRKEKENHYYNAKNDSLIKLGLKPTLLTSNEIIRLAKYVLQHKKNINKSIINPKTKLGMKILITGGLGFIGKNLVSILCRYKKITKIIVIDKNIPDRKYLRDIHDYCYFSNKNKYKSNSKRINIIKCNTNNFNFALDITKNIDYVIHLAAESGVDISIKRPNDSFMTNVVGTFNYLEASRINNIKNFIFSSSGAVFGDANPPMKIKYHKQPISPYGSSKLTIETYCYTYSSIFKIPTTVLRFSNAYGEYSSNKKSIVAQIIKSYLNDSDISIYGDGTQSRDFIYVKDICSAIIKCLKKSSGYNEHHIGTLRNVH